MVSETLVATDAVVVVDHGRAQAQVRELAQQRGRVAFRAPPSARLLGALTVDLLFGDERQRRVFEEQCAG